MLDYKDEIISNQQKTIITLVREHSIEIGKLKRELEIAKSNVKEVDYYVTIDGTKLTAPETTIVKNEITPLALEQAKNGLLTLPTYKSECFVSIRPNKQEIDELEIMLSASERENLELKRIIENQKEQLLELSEYDVSQYDWVIFNEKNVKTKVFRKGKKEYCREIEFKHEVDNCAEIKITY